MKSILFTDVKRLMKNKFNRIYLLQIFCIILMLITSISNSLAIKKTERNVDFRYFNQTRTLETLYNVDINTLNGDVTPRIKASQPTL